MKIFTLRCAIALAALAPAAALAQGTGAAPVDTSYGNPQPQEDEGVPWGLLGLLGLAGLLGARRADRTRDDGVRR